jgi:hypothetical protein
LSVNAKAAVTLPLSVECLLSGLFSLFLTTEN